MHTQRNSGVCMLLLRLHSKGLEPAVAGAQKDTSYLFDSPEPFLAMKSLAVGGFIPACLVEMRNLNSKAFQLKVGFNEEPIVENIFRPKSDFDQVL